MANQSTEVVHLRLPVKLYRMAQVAAIKDKRTLANLIRMIIERHFEAKKVQP